MAYQARTIKEMLGGLYDLVGLTSDLESLTSEQRGTIRQLYHEVNPAFH